MKRGSVTVFCTLSLMLIASLLFALLESARLYGLDRYAAMKAGTAIDSVCAEYQPYLWKQYGLLFLDGAYGTEQFSMGYVMEQLENSMEANCETTGWLQDWLGSDLFRLKKGEVLLEGYALATDDEGELFLNYVAEREKENLPLGVAEDLYRRYQQADELEQYGGIESSIAEAQETIAEAKCQWIARQEEERKRKENEENEEEDTLEPTPVIPVPDTSALDNLLDAVQQMLSSGTLNAIFGDLSGISGKTSRPQNDLQTREKEVGTVYLKTDKDWYQKLLVLNYLEEYFANYASPNNQHFLCYEMEYVLCGKDTEWENLDSALECILLLREAANVTYLLQDSEKMMQAEEMAGLVGALAGGNPGVVKAVQLGIIAAWAYMESVLDVRMLVAGGVIPLIKQESEWTSSKESLFAAFDKNAKAKKCESGLSYTDYLKQLLFLTDNKKIAYRMMEVMELGMQSQEEYKNCRMDYMIAMLRFQVNFESEPVFSSLVSLGNVYRGKYIFTKEIERSYVP